METSKKDTISGFPKTLIDALHAQTKQIVSDVIALNRQNETDDEQILINKANRPSSPIDEKQQMRLVKNVAIAVRDLLQTLDRAPQRIKDMVSSSLIDDFLNSSYSLNFY